MIKWTTLDQIPENAFFSYDGDADRRAAVYQKGACDEETGLYICYAESGVETTTLRGKAPVKVGYTQNADGSIEFHIAERVKMLSDMTYSDFSQYLEDNYELEPIIYAAGPDGFEVYEIDGHYYFYDCEEEGSSDDFYEITPIASLSFKDTSSFRQLQDLPRMFEGICCCGLNTSKDGYMWFKQTTKECA